MTMRTNRVGLKNGHSGEIGLARRSEHLRGEIEFDAGAKTQSTLDAESGRGATRKAIESHVRAILELVGENPDREGLLLTPQRVAAMYEELLEGYRQDVDSLINDALFDVDYGEGEMVVVADIEFSSLCEHHLLPFTGRAHIGYVPGSKVVGLSKIPRIVDMFARRLQVQERMTNEIADALEGALVTGGVMVVIEGEHSCASLRGVRKRGANMVTTARRGLYASDAALRDEFFRLIGR